MAVVQLGGADCARISAIPQASETYQFNNQQLLLSIPQIALRPHYTGIAPQALWNDGIPAFLMDYQASSFRSSYRSNGATLNTKRYGCSVIAWLEFWGVAFT